MTALALLCTSTAVLSASIPAGVVELTLNVVDDNGRHLVRKGRGVLIGPRTVLTAAHVVASLYSPKMGRFNYRVLGDKIRVKELRSGRSVSVLAEQIYYHSSVPVGEYKGHWAIKQADISRYLMGQKRFFDIAVVGLSEPLHSERMPVLAKTYPGIFQKLKVVVGPSKPRLVETTVTGSDRYAVHTRVALDGALRDSATSQGDSGGPLFDVIKDKGYPKVFGIASTLTTGANGAWKSSFFSRVDVIRDWVLRKRKCIEARRSCAVDT